MTCLGWCTNWDGEAGGAPCTHDMWLEGRKAAVAMLQGIQTVVMLTEQQALIANMVCHHQHGASWHSRQ